MAKTPQLLDRWGKPVQRTTLTEEIATASTTGSRSPFTGYPADGMTPVTLAQILRGADHGNPVRYLELAQTIEERDLHYTGVLGTRRRSVTQLDVTVEAGSEGAKDEEIAQRVRDWLDRDELTDELFNILDAIGKGYSFTEIIWDTSQGQWEPLRLEYCDPRWFRFDRIDLTTPQMINDSGTEEPLPPYKFICGKIKAKSGIALRSGLARIVAWGWMFKMYTQRDWAIFTQTYGQPVRVGKYQTGATKEERDTLFRAVANIAGDCAAIIPASMEVEFVEAGNLSAAADLYLKRADWLDKQVSKAVLGQTSTTDAETGGLGSGKEHREVQQDIETADAKALAAILNQDLIRPWVDLEYGPQKKYPKIKIGRPDAEDLAALTNAVATLVPLGLKVSMAELRGKFNLSEPKGEDDILGQKPEIEPPAGDAGEPEAPGSKIKRKRGPIERRPDPRRGDTAELSRRPSEGLSAAPDAVADLTDELSREAATGMAAMLTQIEELMAEARSLPEFREMLIARFDDLDQSQLAATLEAAMLAAHAGGRATVEEEAGE